MEEFKIGEPVICIESHKLGHFQEGQIFIVQGIKKNSCCGNILINIGISNSFKTMRCNRCGISKENDFFYRASRFKPLKSEFKTISYSKVLEQEKEFVGVN